MIRASELPVTWQKSSYSSNNGGDCVEVGTWLKSSHSTNGGNCLEIGAWLKSSHSGPNGGDCLEWAPARIPTGAVPIRDSKTAPHGPALLVPAAAWQTFVTAISDRRLPL